MSPSLWIGKAERRLQSAELLLLDGDFDSACNRAYYAMFSAARAALIGKGLNQAAAAKTHKGLIAIFGEHLIKSGDLEQAHGRTFSLESKRREASDYRGEDISAEEAAESIANAKAFVNAVVSWLSRPTDAVDPES